MHGSAADLDKAMRMPASRIELGFRRTLTGKTFLSHQFAGYPFHICRPHHFNGDPDGMVTLYLQSVAGGMFEGDRLGVDIAAEPGAELHVTSQASTIVHSMDRDHAEITLRISAGESALVEYVPDSTILFPRARLSSRICIRLHETASAIVADAFFGHDPDGCAGMFNWIANDTTVTDPSGQTIVRDRFRITGELLRRRFPGLNGAFLAQSSVIVLHRRTSVDPLLERLRAELEAMPETYAGVSKLPGEAGLVTRILASDGHALRRAVLAVWSAARTHITGMQPVVRRK